MKKREKIKPAEAMRRVDRILLEVRAEIEKAVKKHGGMASSHEGWAVIQEELDELWDEVKADRGYQKSAMGEALQVAAMGVKYIAYLDSTR
jgi:hypothetical protein